MKPTLALVLVLGGCGEESMPEDVGYWYIAGEGFCNNGNLLPRCGLATGIEWLGGTSKWETVRLATTLVVLEGDYISLRPESFNGYTVRWVVTVYDQDGAGKTTTYAQ